MDTWANTREKLSATTAIAQALFMQLVKKDYYTKTERQILRGSRQTSLPFFSYQGATVHRPSAMTEDPDTGEFLPVTTIADRAKETVKDLGYRMRVAALTQSRFASMYLWDAIGFEFTSIALVEAMCGQGFRIRSEIGDIVHHCGYKTFNVYLILEFNTAWFGAKPSFVNKVWPDISSTRVSENGEIEWPPSMGAPVLLPSPVDTWRKRVDAAWNGRRIETNSGM